MAPISLRVKVPQLEVFLLSEMNFRDGSTDFSGDESFASPRTLMVEEDAVYREHAVCLPIVDGDPVGIQLGTAWENIFKFSIRYERISNFLTGGIASCCLSSSH